MTILRNQILPRDLRRYSVGQYLTLFGGKFTGLLDLYPGAAAVWAHVALARSWISNDTDEVRRSSDSATQSFTASQILSGAMLTFVNTDPNPYNSDFSAGIDGFSAALGSVVGNIDSIGGLDDNLRFMVDTASSGAHSATRTSLLVVGQSFQVTGQFYIPSGQNSIDGIRIMDSAATFQDRHHSPNLDEWVSFDTGSVSPGATSLNFRPLDGGSNTVFDATGTDVFYIRNINVTQLTADGFVPKEYDQSGVTVRDGTQATTTEQIKIVDAGTLVTDGNGNVSTLWDGVDDDLDVVAGFAGLTSANVYAITDNAGAVTLDTLTAQDISLATNISTILASLTYDKVTAVIIYPDATDQAGIEASLNETFGT